MLLYSLYILLIFYLYCVLQLWRINKETFRFRVFNKQFVGLDGYNVVAISNSSIDSETFHIVKESDNSTRVRIKASNGSFLQVIILGGIYYFFIQSLRYK